MIDGLQPTTDREILLAIHHDVRELKDRMPKLEQRVTSVEEDSNDRLVKLERWQFAVSWVGGPLWGIAMVIVGVILTTIFRVFWH